MSEGARVLVINPNSNPRVTAGIDEALRGLAGSTGATVDVVGLSGTPFGIETQRDVDAVAGPIAARIQEQESGGSGGGGRADADYDVFVIACFSDPGLHGAREVTEKPVFGIASVGMLSALAIGNAVGVISILATSLPRHHRLYRAMGIADRVIADLPVGASVAELSTADGMFERMRDTGRRLVDEHGADVLVLGCAGMAHFRPRLEEELGVSVIDPTQATVGMAITAQALGYATR